MSNLWISFRTLRKTPAVTAISVLTLALGIGVTTAVFSVVKAILLNPLAYRQPDRLVTVAEKSSDRPDNPYVDAVSVQDWRTRSHSFENLALYADLREMVERKSFVVYGSSTTFSTHLV